MRLAIYIGTFIAAAVIIIVVVLLLISNDNGKAVAVDPQKETNSEKDWPQNIARLTNNLSRLPEGKQYLGWHVGFNQQNPPETQTAIEQAIDAAHELMEVDIHHFDWKDLEPQKGAYDLQGFRDYLSDMKAFGKRPLLFIPAIDSAGFVVPDDLGKTDETVLFSNRSLDDPLILSRYQALLNTIIPIAIEITNNTVWGIVIGNEPDGLIEDFPERSDEIINFISAVRQHVESMDLEPPLGVAMVTTSAVEDPRKDAIIQQKIQAVTQAGSFAAYNVYCDHTIPDGASYLPTKERFDRLVDISDGKSIVIQECGCSSGSAQFVISWFMSEEMQVEWMNTMEHILLEYPQIRATFWFTLVDGSPEFYGYFDDLLVSEIGESCPKDDTWCEELMTNYTQNAKAAIATYGLIDYETGRSKPGLERFLSWLNSKP